MFYDILGAGGVIFMAHVQKYTATAVGHMLDHYGRKANDGVQRSNQEINPLLTGNNWNVADNLQPLPQMDFLHKRLSEVKVQKRKDVNVMCDWVITLPKDFPTERKTEFFKQSFDFLCNRYGEDNVISAWVHEDETTPHMHFAFIPVTENKRKGGYKVSAKDVLTRTDLQSFHSDLQHYLENTLNMSVGILNGATVGGNRAIAELKQQTVMEQLQHITKQISSAEQEKEQLSQQIRTTKKKITELNGKVMTLEEVKAVQGKKSITGSLKNVSYEDYVSLKRTALSVKKVSKENNELRQQVQVLQEENKRLTENANRLSTKLMIEHKQALDEKDKKMDERS